MVRSRSASFSDDDLQLISFQMAAEVQSQQSQSAQSSQPSQPKTPLRPTSGNKDIIDLASSPAGHGKQAATPTPEFGKPTKLSSQPGKMFASLYKKEKDNVFLKPKNRPEHHRGIAISGPSALKYDDRKAAPLPVYTSLPPPRQDSGLSAENDFFSQPAAFEDQVFYTDPKKASEDLKALLEGGMDEDDVEKIPEGDTNVEDGTLEGVKVKLLPHQQEGIDWMKGRELGPVKRGKVPKGGILADDMGLGKTLQSISLIISSPKPKKEDKGWKKHYEGIGKGTLVVAPLALIRQWEAEIAEKVTSSHRLSVCVHHGPSRTKNFRDLAKYDVVITTYQILVSEHGHSTDAVGAGCFGIHWFRVILDEAHSIKNRNAKATKACCALRTEFRWCLTGTPMQNNLDELQSLVHFLRIAPYDNLQHWREYIDGPMKNGKGHIAIRRLHSILRCFMKRRTKDILKEEGALNPGGKKALDAAAAKGDGKPAPVPTFKVTERKVVTVSAELSPAERRFYNRLEERADQSLQKMMKGKVNYANALVLLLRLRQACNHPRLVGIKMEKDKDALSMDTMPPKDADSDMDALTVALGGMDIQAKQCDVCMSDLSKDEANSGISVCKACNDDRAEFTNDSPEQKRSLKKKKKVTKVVKEQVKVEVRQRRPRNRRAVIDSDDEEGTWLVPDDQQGSLRLGKAGGEEDENADGGGEWLNSEDSIHHSEDETENGSRLDSFVVDDEDTQGELERTTGSVSDGDSFLSISKLNSQVLSAKKKKKVPQQSSLESGNSSETGSDPESDSDLDSGVSASSDDGDTDAWMYKRRKGASGSRHVVPSAKIRQLIKILHKEIHEHKFIVFSQFTSMLDLIEPFFEKEGFKYTRYDGGMRNDQREESLRALRSDRSTRVLLCSLKCGSLGLNLTAATRVVILEPFWNPFVEEQAIDRVHRLTQTIDVVVYKLTVEQSVEERILELQEKKRLLAQQAIDGGMKKKGKMGLGLQEMLALFNHDAWSGRGGGAPGTDLDNFIDGRTVAQDVASLTGLGGFSRQSSKPGEKPRVDPAFERRWD